MTAVATRLQVDLFHRGTAATAACLAALAGIGGGALLNDTGTRVGHRADLRSWARGTRLVSYDSGGDVRPFVQSTRVERILGLSGLSQRQLGEVLGVSHTLIGRWTRTEPSRDDLTQILQVIENAQRYHGDLKAWIRGAIPGTDVTPLLLLKARNWRALQGAVRAKAAPPPLIDAHTLTAHRQDEVSWAVAERAVPALDE